MSLLPIFCASSISAFRAHEMRRHLKFLCAFLNGLFETQ
jgi:hypothetical protein